MLDECVKEYGQGRAERRHFMVNLARLWIVVNFSLHISTQPRSVKSMRTWEPRWPNTLKQSVMRSMERQSEELWKDIKRKMEGVVVEMDIAFTAKFWTCPIGERLMTMRMHWIKQNWSLKTRILGMINSP